MQKLVFILVLVILISILQVAPVLCITVSGRVIDKYGNPIKDATIEAYTSSGVFVNKAKSDDKGEFYLGLDKGVYVFVIYARGYEEKRISMEIKTGTFVRIGDITLDYAYYIYVEADSIAVKQGDKISLQVSITNRGHYEESVNVIIVKPLNWNARLLSPKGYEVKGFSLPPGGSENFILEVEVARNVIGNYTVKLILKGITTVVKKIVFDVMKREWNILSAQYTKVIGYKGEELTVDLIAKNTLGSDAIIDFRVVAPAGWDARLETKDGKTIRSLNLKSGEEYELVLHAFIPEGIEEKTYNIIINASGLGASSILNIEVEVRQGKDDLTVESASPFVETRPGEKVSIPIKVSNRGTAPTPVTLTVEGLPESFRYSFRETGGALISKIFLTPGETHSLILEISIPYGLEPQSISFLLKVQGKYSSDTLELGIQILGEIRLRILTENFYVTTTVGSRAKFTLRVRNDGNSPITNLQLTAYDVPGGITVTIDPNLVVSLPSGEEVTFTLTIDIDPNLAPGFYHVPLRLEATGVRVERVLEVEVKPRSEYFFFGLVVLLIVLLVIAYVWRKYGKK